MPSDNFETNTTYFLLVICNTKYTVMLGYSSYSLISDSQTLQKSVPEGYQHLYQYDSSASTESILVKISLTYFIGKVDLLVSESLPIPEKSFLTENWSFGKTLELQLNPGETLFISIVGLDATDYTLVIDIGKDIQLNTEQVSGLINEGDMGRYKYNMPLFSSLKIKLSIFSGECDLYIKVGSSVSLAKYDWAFTDHGSKVIALSPEDQSKHPGSMYSIGVYGKKASAYLLTVTSKNLTITEMASGLPYIGTVKHKEFELYSINITAEQLLQIHLLAATGNPDLYAKKFTTSCIFNEKEIINISIFF